MEHKPHIETKVAMEESQKIPSVVDRVAAALSEHAAVAATAESQLSSQQIHEVDAREEVLMGADSPDGPPPEHWLRQIEWKWFRYVMIALALGAAIWIAVGGVSGGTVLMGFAFLVVMVFAAAPVWGAAILRAQESRAARAKAIREIQSTTINGARKMFPGSGQFKREPDVQVICVKEDSNV